MIEIYYQKQNRQYATRAAHLKDTYDWNMDKRGKYAVASVLNLRLSFNWQEVCARVEHSNFDNISAVYSNSLHVIPTNLSNGIWFKLYKLKEAIYLYFLHSVLNNNFQYYSNIRISKWLIIEVIYINKKWTGYGIYECGIKWILESFLANNSILF